MFVSSKGAERQRANPQQFSIISIRTHDSIGHEAYIHSHSESFTPGKQQT